MTVAAVPWAIQAASHPATAVRQANQGSFGSPFGAFAGGIQPTTAGGGHGVVGAADFLVTQNGSPNMSVNVAGGLCAIRGTEAAAQGVYGPAYNDAAVNLAIAASDPTNPRNDLIVAKIRDAQYSGASNDFSLAVVTGTPNASPVDPAVPNNAVVLARVRVDAAVSSIVTAKITDLRTRAYALGGVAVGPAAFVSSTVHQGDIAYVSNAALPTGAVAPATVPRPNSPGLYIYDVRWDPPWNLPWGIMDSNLNSAAVGPFNASTDIVTGNGFTAVANRQIKVTVKWGVVLGTVANDIFTMRIMEGAGVIDSINLPPLSAVSGAMGGSFVVAFSSTAGAHTYKLNCARVAGTGNATVQNAASIYSSILVEDIGPAGQPA